MGRPVPGWTFALASSSRPNAVSGLFPSTGPAMAGPRLRRLASIAADVHAIADELGMARFATLGLSGGGPGALAAAAVPGGRVSRVGIASGAGPFQRVPGALGELDDNDRAAVALLPGDPAGAAAAFAAGFEPLVELVRADDGPGIVSAFQELLSPRDNELLRDPRLAAAFAETAREGLRPGNQRRWLGQRLPGSGNGTSTWAPSPARSCCGTGARTAWVAGSAT